MEELSKRSDDVHKRLDDLRGDMNTRFAEVNQRFAELRGDVDRRFSQLFWQMNIWFSLLTLLTILFKFIR